MTILEKLKANPVVVGDLIRAVAAVLTLFGVAAAAGDAEKVIALIGTLFTVFGPTIPVRARVTPERKARARIAHAYALGHGDGDDPLEYP